MDEWCCYIIKNRKYTYVGVSNNAEKRLRAHNGEISGGAKYTTSKGKGWKHVCIIKGFPTKIESLQFEWALKHISPKKAGGIENRIKKLEILLNKKRWTSRSPLSETMPLIIEWVDEKYKKDMELPIFINQIISPHSQ